MLAPEDQGNIGYAKKSCETKRSCEAGKPCEIWGVLNVTPDSFSDGGLYADPKRAFARAEEMIAEGADVIDIGGRSTRPRGQTYGQGSAKVSVKLEMERVLPVLELLTPCDVRVSVDTTSAELARASLSRGASIINDVSCGRVEELLKAVASMEAQLVLMHNRGEGEVTPDNTDYTDVVHDVRDELLAAVARAERVGVARTNIWLDPGLGFAKTWQQSLELLAHLDLLVQEGFPVLLGASRKSFIAKAVERGGAAPAASERLAGSLCSVAVAVFSQASAVRVHDVAFSKQAVAFSQALSEQRRASWRR